MSVQLNRLILGAQDTHKSFTVKHLQHVGFRRSFEMVLWKEGNPATFPKHWHLIEVPFYPWSDTEHCFKPSCWRDLLTTPAWAQPLKLELISESSTIFWGECNFPEVRNDNLNFQNPHLHVLATTSHACLNNVVHLGAMEENMDSNPRTSSLLEGNTLLLGFPTLDLFALPAVFTHINNLLHLTQKKRTTGFTLTYSAALRPEKSILLAAVLNINMNDDILTHNPAWYLNYSWLSLLRIYLTCFPTWSLFLNISLPQPKLHPIQGLESSGSVEDCSVLCGCSW